MGAPPMTSAAEPVDEIARLAVDVAFRGLLQAL
jgi:hypothetical protein